MRRLDHIRRDRQIIVKEIGGLPVIGVDPTHRRRREENDIGTIFVEPGEDRGLIPQIEDFPAQRQEPAILLSQAPDQGRAQHPAMPGDADALALEIERRIIHYVDPDGVSRTRRILSAAPHRDIADRRLGAS